VQKIKKLLAVAVLLMALPVLSLLAAKLVLGSSSNIYKYIPETSDIVVEVNCRNFVREIMFQRIFREDYFNEAIIIEEDEVSPVPPGLDPLSSIIAFREQWADENIWMAIVGITSREGFEPYLKEQMAGAHYEFGGDYVLIQLTPSNQQEAVVEHMKKIMAGEVKSFKERVDLTELFDQSKEINCYVIPNSDNEHNQFINGNLSFDFLQDHVKVDGEFTPVSGFGENAPVAYAINEESAVSIRSSLNLVHSIYWFNEQIVKGIPEYSQMALDYDAMSMFMVHKKLGYPFSMKFFPEMQMRFDIIEPQEWQTFFDTLKADNSIKMDTASHTFVENQVGFFFQYRFDDQKFELMRDQVILIPSTEEKLYFALHVKIEPLLDNITFLVDEENPPSPIEQSLGLMVAEAMVDELKVMSNIEHVHFELKLKDETIMLANGSVQMVNKNGNSIIESMSFGKAALAFFTSYLSGGAVASEE
jgi:hypothetical protein